MTLSRFAVTLRPLCVFGPRTRLPPAMEFLLAKALHIVGFISWFAGLFYIVRLFIYFVEAGEKSAHDADVIRQQLGLMQRRLWNIITRPAMIVTLLAGGWTIHARYGFANMPGWLHLKLGFLVLLVGYHHVCGRILAQQARGECRWTSAKLRMFNEVATLLMVAIVFLAVFKTGMSAVWGMLGLLVLGIILMIAVRLYRNRLAKMASGEPTEN